MLNGQLNDFASASHLTQVASYFDIVDAAVKTGDTNKRYTLSSNTSTAPSPPIPAGSWTNIHIAPTADNMCDLYNSFIEVQMEVQLKADINTAAGACGTAKENLPSVWVGFKDAMDAIESYQIVSNGQVVYTQPHAIEESFITNLACPDAVKNRDIFSKTTVKNIWNKTETVVTGGLVTWADTEVMNSEIKKITLYLKIDLRRFLPLSGVKYLPAFVGNLELRVKFSTAGLVCVPMPWKDFISKWKDRLIVTGGVPECTCCFTPIGKSVTMYNGWDDSAKSPKTVSLALNVISMTIKECYSILACFGIDDAIYQQLVQRYTGQSLSFPTQTLTFQAMNGTCSKDKVDLALTSTPRFVDTIFILFPQTPEYRTCYQNPLFDSLRLTMGGYGSMPDIEISSYGMVNYEMLTNALNANNDLTGLAKDVMISATPNNTIKWSDARLGLKPYDCTNFALAFPVSVDNSFQQGQTSSAPITYQFKATPNKENSFIKDDNTNCTPIMGFLKDSVFAIQIRPSGPPIVALDEFDISSPAGA